MECDEIDWGWIFIINCIFDYLSVLFAYKIENLFSKKIILFFW